MNTLLVVGLYLKSCTSYEDCNINRRRTDSSFSFLLRLIKANEMRKSYLFCCRPLGAQTQQFGHRGGVPRPWRAVTTPYTSRSGNMTDIPSSRSRSNSALTKINIITSSAVLTGCCFNHVVFLLQVGFIKLRQAKAINCIQRRAK